MRNPAPLILSLILAAVGVWHVFSYQSLSLDAQRGKARWTHHRLMRARTSECPIDDICLVECILPLNETGHLRGLGIARNRTDDFMLIASFRNKKADDDYWATLPLAVRQRPMNPVTFTVFIRAFW